MKTYLGAFLLVLIVFTSALILRRWWINSISHKVGGGRTSSSRLGISDPILYLKNIYFSPNGDETFLQFKDAPTGSLTFTTFTTLGDEFFVTGTKTILTDMGITGDSSILKFTTNSFYVLKEDEPSIIFYTDDAGGAEASDFITFYESSETSANLSLFTEGEVISTQVSTQAKYIIIKYKIKNPNYNLFIKQNPEENPEENS